MDPQNSEDRRGRKRKHFRFAPDSEWIDFSEGEPKRGSAETRTVENMPLFATPSRQRVEEKRINIRSLKRALRCLQDHEWTAQDHVDQHYKRFIDEHTRSLKHESDQFKRFKREARTADMITAFSKSHQLIESLKSKEKRLQTCLNLLNKKADEFLRESHRKAQETGYCPPGRWCTKEQFKRWLEEKSDKELFDDLLGKLTTRREKAVELQDPSLQHPFCWETEEGETILSLRDMERDIHHLTGTPHRT